MRPQVLHQDSRHDGKADGMRSPPPPSLTPHSSRAFKPSTRRTSSTATSNPTTFSLGVPRPRLRTSCTSSTLAWPSSTATQKRSSTSPTARESRSPAPLATCPSTLISVEVRLSCSSAALTLSRAVEEGRSRGVGSRLYVLSARGAAVAGAQGGDEQAEVREDWREEAEHSHQGVGRGVPRYVPLPPPFQS